MSIVSRAFDRRVVPVGGVVVGGLRLFASGALVVLVGATLAAGFERGAAAETSAAAVFTDISTAPVNDPGSGAGAAWVDYDGDGALDLYLVNNGSENRLFRNNGNTSFSNVTTGPLAGGSSGAGVAWADYDNDADMDAFLAIPGGASKLLRNDGGGLFTDVTSAAGLSGPVGAGSAAWGDYDNDGRADLCVGIVATGGGRKVYLFHNDGASFSDASSGLQSPGGGTTLVRGVCWADYNGDGWLDAYVACENADGRLMRNDHDGTFSSFSGNPLRGPASRDCQGSVWGDFDGDGDLDLYLVSSGFRTNMMLRNDGVQQTGNPIFTDVSTTALRGVGNGVAAVAMDYDNDGDLDLFLVEQGSLQVLENLSGMNFQDATPAGLTAISGGISAAAGDLDGDGDLDVYVTRTGTSNTLLRNDSSSGRHWLTLRLHGNLSNESAIGARARVVAGGVARVREVSAGDGGLSQGSLDLEFGLNSATTIDSITVRWPRGSIQLVSPPAGVDRLFVVNEPGLPLVDATTGALADAGPGAGVAWIDDDGDGDQDLYLVNNGAANRLFRNAGGGSFTNVAAGPIADAGGGAGVVWGDFDNDGDPDAFIANPSGTSKLLRNDGGGTFADVTGTSGLSALPTGLSCACWGDFDRDGWLDLCVGGVAAPNGKRAMLMRNVRGIFTFITGAISLSGGAGARGMTAVDFDRDGDLDVYAAVDHQRNELFANDGDGSFTLRSNGPLRGSGGQDGRAAAWGDYDNDGDLDLYLVNAAPGTNMLLRNDTMGALPSFVEITNGAPAAPDSGVAATWVDFDNDGDLDLVVLETTRVLAFENSGTGSFSETSSAALGGLTAAVGAAWGDADGDGGQDLYLSRVTGPNRYLKNNDGSGHRWLDVRLRGVLSNASAIGSRVRVVAGNLVLVRDVFGGDGAQSQSSFDLHFGLGTATSIDSVVVVWTSGIVQVVAPTPALNSRVVVAEHGGGFAAAVAGPISDAGTSESAAWGDYDGDGLLDVYVANFGTGQTNHLLRNNGDGGFVDTTPPALSGLGVSTGVAWADFDNDGDLDLTLANSGQPSQLLRHDAGTTWTSVTIPAFQSLNSAGTGWADFDNDGDLDLYVTNLGQPNQLLRNDGGGAFVDIASGPVADPGFGEAVAWGDYDGDGFIDLYFTNAGGTNRLLHNTAGGGFTDATIGALGGQGAGRGAAWADFDGDGTLDLGIADASTQGVRLLKNFGASFADVTPAALTPVSNASGLSWGDFDNDGDPDLYVTSGSAPGNRLFRNDGGGMFTDVTIGPLASAHDGVEAQWVDYDGDGRLDLYVVNYAGANELLKNGIANANHWLGLRLRGVVSNRDGVGARIRVVAGGKSQTMQFTGGSGYLSQSIQPVHVGLGTATFADSVVIRWPSGANQVLLHVAPLGRVVTVEEAATSTDVPGGSPAAGRLWLGPAIPNPFRSTTRIDFELPSAREVDLAVFDLQGRRVDTLARGRLTPGTHSMTWDGRSSDHALLGAGVYFVRLAVGGERGIMHTRKLVMVR